MVCLRYSIELVLFSTWVFESSFYLFYLHIFRFFIGWLVAGCHSTCLPSGWILQVWYTENRYLLKYKRHRSAKILLLNICWLFFSWYQIFILEHQNHSSLKFTGCKRRRGTICVTLFQSPVSSLLLRKPFSTERVSFATIMGFSHLIILYIYLYLLSWALFF